MSSDSTPYPSDTGSSWGFQQDTQSWTDARDASAMGEVGFSISPLTPVIIVTIAVLYILKRNNWPCCAAPITQQQRRRALQVTDNTASTSVKKVMPLEDIGSIVNEGLAKNSIELTDGHFIPVPASGTENDPNHLEEGASVSPEPSLSRKMSCETRRLGYTIKIPLCSFQRRAKKDLDHADTPTTLDSSLSGSLEGESDANGIQDDIDLEMNAVAGPAVENEDCIIFDTEAQRPSVEPKPPSDTITIDRTCAICLDDFVIGDVVSIAAPQSEGAAPRIERACDHVFHQDCVQEWLVGLERKTQKRRAQGNNKYGAEHEGKMNLTCPCCRQLFLDVPSPISPAP